MNETLQIISQRFSCRCFTDTAISAEKLQAILSAGIQSPSAMNLQPYQLIVVKDKNLIEELDALVLQRISQMPDKTMYDRIMARGGKIFYNCNAIVFVALKNQQPMSYIDCGILSENIVLAATSLGINSVHCGMAGILFSDDSIKIMKERLKFPDGYEFGHAILLGYGENGAPHQPDQSKITMVE
ncbi:MAG: nitroreductase family protein [Anaerocolumna sp.]